MKAKLTSMGLLIVASIFLAGCGAGSSKKISPEVAQTNQLDWNMKTLVTAYQNNGSTDSRWDEPATRALTEFARTRARVTDLYEPWSEIIGTNCEAAVNAGCDDPMIRYLYIKNAMSQTNSPKAFSDAFVEVEGKMQKSQYPDIRKFYVALRAAQQFMFTYGYGTNVDYTVWRQMMGDAASDLVAVLNDKTTPPNEVYDACSEMIYQLPGSPQGFQNYYDTIEKPLMANWPDEAMAWLLKGLAYTQLAWLYRGNGYADSITPEGLKGFNANLDVANKALNHAWDLDPKDARIANAMLNVELGQGKGRDVMELWFDRAMKDDPDNYDACNGKLTYIEPKWYGSVNDMLEFGRECVTNAAWGGTVPLILVDAHYNIYNEFIDASERTNYWQQPDVWADISSAYERYLGDNPDDASRVAYYARYAFYAKQWNKLNELLPKVSPDYYSLFGGKDAFDQIVQQAKENATQH
ncbi:MAG TPA: hypothetical protein VMH87_20195 [Pseudomonadales bacterium]|nr:hypothetical protein [Pseudomonadales bacterium]